MNEITTAPATEFDLLPCCICGKQPDLVEEPRYSFRCCCFACSSLLEYPSADLAAEKWNSMNDLSGFETDCEPEHSPAVKSEGIFQTLEKHLASFFRPYDLGYFLLMFFVLHVPFMFIAKLIGLEDDLFQLSVVSCQSFLFSAAVAGAFAFLRWIAFGEEENSSL